MASSLSPATIAIVKATVPALEEHGVEIVKSFYSKLFTKYPVSAGYFNRDRVAPAGSKHAGVPPQVAALGGAVIAYAKNIEDISPLLPIVERICHKHVSRGVVKPHYTLVGECLLAGISEVLGPDIATEDVLAAWKEAYKHLANAFIDIETQVREEGYASAGYKGYAEFQITRITEHSGGKTFELVAQESGTPIPQHRGGQYISFEIEEVEGLGKCKTTAMLSDVDPEKLIFTVAPNSERPIQHMLNVWGEGDLVRTSIPCGPYKIERSRVAHLVELVMAGRPGDYAVMMAVANDIAKNLCTGIEHVTFLVEQEGSCDLPFSVPCRLSVKTVREITSSYIGQMLEDVEVSGVFVAPSMKTAVTSLPSGVYKSIME